MDEGERSRIIADAEQCVADCQWLVEQRNESLRRQGIDPEKFREQVTAKLQEDPELKRDVEASVGHALEQANSHRGFYAATHARRKKAPRATI